MSADPFVRQADENDSETLVHLYRQLDPGSGRPDGNTVRALLARLRSYPDYRVYLAFRNGRIAGTFAMLIMDTLGSRCAPAAVVEDVVVDESERGEGMGRLMMEFALEKAREAGCYKLVVSSNLGRADAHRFYDAIGFRKHGFSFVVEPERDHRP